METRSSEHNPLITRSTSRNILLELRKHARVISTISEFLTPEDYTHLQVTGHVIHGPVVLGYCDRYGGKICDAFTNSCLKIHYQWDPKYCYEPLVESNVKQMSRSYANGNYGETTYACVKWTVGSAIYLGVGGPLRVLNGVGSCTIGTALCILGCFAGGARDTVDYCRQLDKPGIGMERPQKSSGPPEHRMR